MRKDARVRPGIAREPGKVGDGDGSAIVAIPVRNSRHSDRPPTIFGLSDSAHSRDQPAGLKGAMCGRLRVGNDLLQPRRTPLQRRKLRQCGRRDFASAEAGDGKGSARRPHRWASAAQTISWI